MSASKSKTWILVGALAATGAVLFVAWWAFSAAGPRSISESSVAFLNQGRRPGACLRWTAWDVAAGKPMPADWVAVQKGFRTPVAAEVPPGSGNWLLGSTFGLGGVFSYDGVAHGPQDVLYSVAPDKPGGNCPLARTKDVAQALRMGPTAPVCFDFSSRSQFSPFEGGACQGKEGYKDLVHA